MKPNHFYMRVWRWHFYAGLFTLPFLFLLACTGIVYLFRNEIEDIVYRDKIFVGAVNHPIPLTEQRVFAEAILPDSNLQKVIPPAEADRATQFVFSAKDGNDETVFVNPSNGVVTGTRIESSRPSAVALKIHGELLIGKAGDLLMELAASWSLILVLSGIYLWFPRGEVSRFWGVVLPRFSKLNGRLPWRDLHSVTGFWVSLILLYFAFTGLFWTGIWGNKFVKPWNTFPTEMWNDVPNSNLTNQDLNSADSKIVPWAAEDLPVPTSIECHGHHGNSSLKPSAKLNSVVSLDSVQIVANEKGVLKARSISVPTSPSGVYTVTAIAQIPEEEELLHIDQYSGKVLSEVRYAQYSTAAKVVATSIAIHEGRGFGLVNKILSLIGCILVIVLTVSAFILWWRRKPSRTSLAAPSRVVFSKPWKGAIALIAVFAVIFPTAGVSLVVVLALDFLVLRKLSRQKSRLNSDL